MATSELHKLILGLAARASGVGTSEISHRAGIEISRASHICRNLRISGKLYSLRLSHKHSLYFARESDRDTVARGLPPAASPPLRLMAAKAPVFPPDAEVIVPPHVKVQVGPSHPPRFEEKVFPFVRGWKR